MRGAGPSPCPIDHTSYMCQLILYQFSFALWVQNSCKKNLCNSMCKSIGNHGSSWDFRCLNQTQRDTVAKQPQETAQNNGASTRNAGFICPQPRSESLGKTELQRTLQDGLLALGPSFTANSSPVISKKSLGSKGPGVPTHSHHDKAKLPSQMLMELHCIYLGTARDGAWTKTSQDQSGSTTGRLQTALLCYPAAVRTVGCARIYEPGNRSVSVRNKTEPYLKLGQMWNIFARLPLSQKQDQKYGPHQPQTLTLSVRECRQITRAGKNQTLLSHRFFYRHEAPGYHLCLWTDFLHWAFGLSPASREC